MIEVTRTMASSARVMGGISLLVASAFLTSLAADAQDPTVTLPDAYRVQLENAYVRVVRVHYPAGAKLAEHTHPAGTTAYIYLNDSPGVIFRHSGSSNRAVTRRRMPLRPCALTS